MAGHPHQFAAELSAPLTFVAAIYLPCFALVMVGGAVLVGALAALLAISTVALVIASPAFALAVSIEAYFHRQAAKMRPR